MCNCSELLEDPVLAEEEEEGVPDGSPPLLEDKEPVDEEPVEGGVLGFSVVDEEPEGGVLGFPVVDEEAVKDEELLLLESAILFFTEGF